MQIMIYYHEYNDFHALNNIIQELSLDITIDETNSFSQAKLLFSEKHYDIVFIDFIAKQSELLIQTILQYNQQQRMVLLNDTCDCYNSKQCKNCQQHYNIATVIKPINLFQMASLLKNDFRCESYTKNEKEFDLERIIKMIIAKYPFLSFDRKKYFFDLSLVVNPLKTSILIELIEVLNQNAIEHHLLDDQLHIVEIST